MQRIEAGEEADRLRHRLAKLPHGHLDEQAIRDRLVQLAAVQHADEIAAEREHAKGTITEADADRVAKNYGMLESDRLRFASFGDVVGATPLERTQFLTAIRAYDGRTPPEPNSLDLRELWGGEAEGNAAAARRVRAAIPAEEWRQHVAPWLGVPGAVNVLAQIGRRMRGGQ